MKKLDAVLCAETPNPVIVGVKVVGITPGHYVLVTEKDQKPDGSPRYVIRDPGSPANPVYLDQAYALRGYIKDPPGDLSSLNATVGDEADIMVVLPSGKRIGYDRSSRSIVREVPDATYHTDRIDDDVDPTQGASTEISHTIHVPQPGAGLFRLVVTGVKGGEYTVIANPVSVDGASQRAIAVSGRAAPGSTATYLVTFNPAVAGTSTVALVAGDVDGDAKVDCSDVRVIRASFGRKSGDVAFDARADVVATAFRRGAQSALA
jgi:hypothetical protein